MAASKFTQCSCVVLGKLLTLSEPVAPDQQAGDTNNAHSSGLLWGLYELQGPWISSWHHMTTGRYRQSL